MGRLDPAGVNLQAKNFNKYIKQLNTIEKEQQEVFGTQNQGLAKSYDRATKPLKTMNDKPAKRPGFNANSIALYLDWL